MRWLLLLLVLSGCSTLPYEEGTVSAYFCLVDDCEAVLLGFLDGADACAFYDSEIHIPEHIALKIHDREDGLMHHKFCVNDTHVLTGSMNPTENGMHRNDNVLLVIDSDVLAGAYLEEFEELEEKTAKGTAVNLSGSLVTVLFCPQEDCEGMVVRTIRTAKESVVFMTFTFTSDPIGDALLDAADRGVRVEGVIEKRQRSKYSELQKLQTWGLNVTEDGNPYTMHHKTFVVDEEIVITGSYNPTWSGANRNDENLLVIRDRDVAAVFSEEFRRVRDEG